MTILAQPQAPSIDANRWHNDARRKRAQDFFEKTAAERPRWKRRNDYYYRQLKRFFQSAIPEGNRVLEVGCGDGNLLAAVKPSYGVGVDWSPTAIEQAKARHAHLKFFVDDAEDLALNEKFDYVILSGLLGGLVDIQRALEALHRVCHPRTRIVITEYSYLWEPFERLAQRLGWKMKQPAQNWLTTPILQEILELAGFEMIRSGRRVLIPVRLPVLSALANRILVRLPLLNRLGLVVTVVARPQAPPVEIAPSFSVVVPCRNERGTICSLIERLPAAGSWTELIFIDGHSSDGTVDEIKRLIGSRPDLRIRVFPQTGKGKATAVREGFAAATGDIITILDADLTVAPEELPKFYRALADRKGEFVNGTRLIYPMDGRAMQMLNLMANKAFSVLFTYLLEQEFHDTLCGTKALWRKDYERIAAQRSFFQHPDPFGDFDLIFGATRLNLQIKEIPVRYCERVYGQTNIHRFRNGWELLKISWVAARRLKFAP
ncbi:MAG: glycosyltransferase [Candidatus Omnitrophica bacterium]|nr:glycosyltransferase [Candidatus Omnitrophota bacterium]